MAGKVGIPHQMQFMWPLHPNGDRTTPCNPRLLTHACRGAGTTNCRMHKHVRLPMTQPSGSAATLASRRRSHLGIPMDKYDVTDVVLLHCPQFGPVKGDHGVPCITARPDNKARTKHVDWSAGVAHRDWYHAKRARLLTLRDPLSGNCSRHV